MNDELKQAIKNMLSATLPKEKWTVCHQFRCVMNTGWAAGEDKYKCRIGKDCNSCGADKIQLKRLNMTKQHPFDDFHQRIHWSGTCIGTVTQQWGNPAPRHGWRLMMEYE